MPEPSGTRALELCLGRDIELMIFAGEQILLDPFSKASLTRTYPDPALHDNAVTVEDPLAYVRERGLPVTKIHGDWNQPAYPLKELRELPGVALTASNDRDFELVPAGVDKGRTLALLSMLAGEQSLLLLDEPTYAQDERSTRFILDLLERRVAEGLTAVLATHDLALARACTNQILLLEDGRLTTLAPAELDAYAAERRMPSCEA